MNEATTLLKTLKPAAKAVKIKRVNAPDGPAGLLNWGGTNALRRGTLQELAGADPVVVELAHGSVELKQHVLTGAILTEHAVEPVVPLRGLIDLSFVIKWNAHGSVKSNALRKEPLNVGCETVVLLCLKNMHLV